MAVTKPMSFRLTKEWLARLDKAAEKMHLSNRTEVMKFCLSTFLDHLEKEGIEYLPANWPAMMREMDGRTHRYDAKLEVNGDHNQTVFSPKAGVVYKIHRSRKGKR
jgi:hypothetical protein